MSDPRLDEVAEPIEPTTITLERLQFNYAQAFRDISWDGAADGLHVGAELDHRLQAMVVQFSTYVMGLPSTTAVVTWPADWKQHLKRAVFDWADRDARRWRLAAFLRRRLGEVKLARQTVQRYATVCPHISAGPNHDKQLCIAFMGRMIERPGRRAARQGMPVHSHADYLVNQAHAVLAVGLTPQPARGFLDFHTQRQDLEGAVRFAQQLLREAMEELE